MLGNKKSELDQGREIRFILKVHSNPLQWLPGSRLGKRCETEFSVRKMLKSISDVCTDGGDCGLLVDFRFVVPDLVLWKFSLNLDNLWQIEARSTFITRCSRMDSCLYTGMWID